MAGEKPLTDPGRLDGTLDMRSSISGFETIIRWNARWLVASQSSSSMRAAGKPTPIERAVRSRITSVTASGTGC
jgi:hypothetical protein